MEAGKNSKANGKALFRVGEQVKVSERPGSPLPNRMTTEYYGTMGEVMDVLTDDHGEPLYKVRMYDRILLKLAHRHLETSWGAEAVGAAGANADKDRAVNNAGRLPPSPAPAGMPKGARVMVLNEDHVSKKQPSLRGQFGVLQEAVEPGAKFVKVKFDSLAKPVKLDTNWLQLADEEDEEEDESGPSSQGSSKENGNPSAVSAPAAPTPEPIESTKVEAPAPAVGAGTGSGSAGALLSTLDPAVWNGRKVRFQEGSGKHDGLTGLVLGSGNGWVQLSTEKGELSGRAYALRLVDDGPGTSDENQPTPAPVSAPSPAMPEAMEEDEEEGRDAVVRQGSGSDGGSERSEGDEMEEEEEEGLMEVDRASSNEDEVVSQVSTQDDAMTEASLELPPALAGVVRGQSDASAGAVSAGVVGKSEEDEEDPDLLPHTALLQIGTAIKTGRKGNHKGKKTAKVVEDPLAAITDGLDLLAGSSTQHALVQPKQVELHAEQVKKHVAKMLERYKDRPNPAQWRAEIEEFANSDSEVEDEAEWQDILELDRRACLWCNTELGPEDEHCWSVCCPASPYFQPSSHARRLARDLAEADKLRAKTLEIRQRCERLKTLAATRPRRVKPRERSLRGDPISSDEEDESEALPTRVRRVSKRMRRMQGESRHSWVVDYPELRFLTHAPAAPLNHTYYNAHALVRIVDTTRKRKRTPASLAPSTPDRPFSTDASLYRWQQYDKIREAQKAALDPTSATTDVEPPSSAAPTPTPTLSTVASRAVSPAPSATDVSQHASPQPPVSASRTSSPTPSTTPSPLASAATSPLPSAARPSSSSFLDNPSAAPRPSGSSLMPRPPAPFSSQTPPTAHRPVPTYAPPLDHAPSLYPPPRALKPEPQLESLFDPSMQRGIYGMPMHQTPSTQHSKPPTPHDAPGGQAGASFYPHSTDPSYSAPKPPAPLTRGPSYPSDHQQAAPPQGPPPPQASREPMPGFHNVHRPNPSPLTQYQGHDMLRPAPQALPYTGPSQTNGPPRGYDDNADQLLSMQQQPPQQGQQQGRGDSWRQMHQWS